MIISAAVMMPDSGLIHHWWLYAYIAACQIMTKSADVIATSCLTYKSNL